MKKRLPVICPSCASSLSVKSLVCESCDTEVAGKFSLPLLLQLSDEEQAFVFDFVQSSGSLKLMAQKLGLSYPTVRNMLDDLIGKMAALQDDNQNRG
jgi:hypothetical protein